MKGHFLRQRIRGQVLVWHYILEVDRCKSEILGFEGLLSLWNWTTGEKGINGFNLYISSDKNGNATVQSLCGVARRVHFHSGGDAKVEAVRVHWRYWRMRQLAAISEDPTLSSVQLLFRILGTLINSLDDQLRRTPKPCTLAHSVDASSGTTCLANFYGNKSWWATSLELLWQRCYLYEGCSKRGSSARSLIFDERWCHLLIWVVTSHMHATQTCLDFCGGEFMDGGWGGSPTT